MSQMMQMYQQVGPAQFSAMIGQFAPYFASIAPQFVELRPGYAEVTFPKRREVLNHIGTVHAIALCNAAELADHGAELSRADLLVHLHHLTHGKLRAFQD